MIRREEPLGGFRASRPYPTNEHTGLTPPNLPFDTYLSCNNACHHARCELKMERVWNTATRRQMDSTDSDVSLPVTLSDVLLVDLLR